MSATFEQVSAAIAALESQRAMLGDAIVETALAPLRRELSELRARDPQTSQQLKQVSVVFVDVVGSTAIGQQLGPEDIHAVMDGALECFTAAVQSNHGRVLQYTGDGMLAAFGSEDASEDDVEDAVRAALDIIDEARRLAPEEPPPSGHAFNKEWDIAKSLRIPLKRSANLRPWRGSTFWTAFSDWR